MGIYWTNQILYSIKQLRRVYEYSSSWTGYYCLFFPQRSTYVKILTLILSILSWASVELVSFETQRKGKRSKQLLQHVGSQLLWNPISPRVTVEVFPWEPVVGGTAVKLAHFYNSLLFPGSYHVVILKLPNGKAAVIEVMLQSLQAAPSDSHLFIILNQQSHEWKN